MRKAVLDAKPDAIVHEATALADIGFSRNMDRTFAQTNRLRTEGTDALLAAAREARVHRFIAQSFASPRYARQGGWVKTEEDPLDSDPPASMRESVAAMAHVDQAVTDAGGIALRYGGFYGASTGEVAVARVAARDGRTDPPGSPAGQEPRHRRSTRDGESPRPRPGLEVLRALR